LKGVAVVNKNNGPVAFLPDIAAVARHRRVAAEDRIGGVLSLPDEFRVRLQVAVGVVDWRIVPRPDRMVASSGRIYSQRTPGKASSGIFR